MTEGKGGNALRSVVTRVVATSILLGVYSVGTVVFTGGVMATTMSTAGARWRGRGADEVGAGAGAEAGAVGKAIARVGRPSMLARCQLP